MASPPTTSNKIPQDPTLAHVPKFTHTRPLGVCWLLPGRAMALSHDEKLRRAPYSSDRDTDMWGFLRVTQWLWQRGQGTIECCWDNFSGSQLRWLRWWCRAPIWIWRCLGVGGWWNDIEKQPSWQGRGDSKKDDDDDIVNDDNNVNKDKSTTTKNMMTGLLRRWWQQCCPHFLTQL